MQPYSGCIITILALKVPPIAIYKMRNGKQSQSVQMWLICTLLPTSLLAVYRHALIPMLITSLRGLIHLTKMPPSPPLGLFFCTVSERMQCTDGQGGARDGARPAEKSKVGREPVYRNLPCPATVSCCEPTAAHTPLLSLNDGSNKFRASRCRSVLESLQPPYVQEYLPRDHLLDRVSWWSASHERGSILGIWAPGISAPCPSQGRLSHRRFPFCPCSTPLMVFQPQTDSRLTPCSLGSVYKCTKDKNLSRPLTEMMTVTHTAFFLIQKYTTRWRSDK